MRGHSNAVATGAMPFAQRRSLWLIQVAGDKRQDHTASRVAMAMASYFNPNEGEEAWPSQQTISGLIKTQRQNVQAALKLSVETANAARHRRLWSPRWHLSILALCLSAQLIH